MMPIRRAIRQHRVLATILLFAMILAGGAAVLTAIPGRPCVRPVAEPPP